MTPGGHLLKFTETATMNHDYMVTVPMSFELYENKEHPAIAAAAKKLRIKHDGGGIDLTDPNRLYDHFYFTKDEADAHAFADEVRKLGFEPKVEKTRDYGSETMNLQFDEADEAYFQSEYDYAKACAKKTIIEFLEKREIPRLYDFGNGQRFHKINVLLSSIDMLRDDLLAWAKEQR
jgi:hypothetical protein